MKDLKQILSGIAGLLFWVFVASLGSSPANKTSIVTMYSKVTPAQSPCSLNVVRCGE